MTVIWVRFFQLNYKRKIQNANNNGFFNGERLLLGQQYAAPNYCLCELVVFTQLLLACPGKQIITLANNPAGYSSHNANKIYKFQR